jgi:3-methyladenine DNA glycosylase AlkD
MSKSNPSRMTGTRPIRSTSPAAEPKLLADEILRLIRALDVPNTPNIRQIRKQYTDALRQADAELVLDMARALLARGEHGWVAYELVHHHRAAMQRIGEPELEEFGRGIDSWWTVDAFSLELSGPAWRERQVEDGLIEWWAKSPDRWWRRAALVSTVALNARARGGRGDVPRTLLVCRILIKDTDDMVAKALSWALRELIPYERQAVQAFLDFNREAIPRRVRREVMNKLALGLKNPRRTTPKVVRQGG